MFSATLREWKRKIEQLRWRAVRQENERLRKENEVLRRREKQWERERERLREENDRLRQQLEEAQRANKRQAAPVSRGTRKEHPKTPGRKPGAAYGRRYLKPALASPFLSEFAQKSPFVPKIYAAVDRFSPE